MMAATFNVFLSYTHADAEIAASLASRLDDAGIRCFLAERDVRPGEEWEPRVREALLASHHIVVLLTPRSKNKRWVNAEAGAAWVLEKPLVAALMFVDPSKLIELIRRHQARRVETPEQVQGFVDDLLNLFGQRKAGDTGRIHAQQQQQELFNDKRDWEGLLKVGRWNFDDVTGRFTGEEVRTYLLSRNRYGPRLTIKTRLRFMECQPRNQVAATNAGVVFGWETPQARPRYYHVMFTGKRLLLELVGAKGGAEYGDFRHIDNGVPFTLEEGREYSLAIFVDSTKLEVFVDEAKQYTADFPDAFPGRVGLRPWRSRISCDHFEVKAR